MCMCEPLHTFLLCSHATYLHCLQGGDALHHVLCCCVCTCRPALPYYCASPGTTLEAPRRAATQREALQVYFREVDTFDFWVRVWCN